MKSKSYRILLCSNKERLEAYEVGTKVTKFKVKSVDELKQEYKTLEQASNT